MKTTFNSIIAAMTAIAVFSSCQKELAGETATNTTDGLRVITVQFDNSTKASLGSDGFTPKFANGDKIRVSNDTESKECEVSVSGGVATFTTDLTGNLTAIYPAAAAAFTGTDPITDPFFKVPASQDGDVARAIIAKATIAAGSSSTTFTSQIALFQITPPSGVTTFKIKSLNTIDASTGQRSTAANAVAINTEGADAAAKSVINVTVPGAGTAYVALVPGVKLSDLSFDAGETYGMKGIPTSKISTDQTAANTKYTINGENWHPYVEIGGKKWATENIGATASNPYGTYFEWGNTTGHALKESPIGKTGKITSAFVSNYNFSWANCPYQTVSTTKESSTKFTKYLGNTSSTYKDASATDADAMKTVLDLTDDAAYANWGGPWRMPTGGTESNADFTALAKAANEGYTSSSFSYTSTITTSGAPSSRGVYYYKVSGETVGVYFVDSSSKKLFFPATGGGNGNSLYDASSDGLYWSSSLKTDEPYYAYDLRFTSDLSDHLVNPQNRYFRYLGYPVRPVSD